MATHNGDNDVTDVYCHHDEDHDLDVKDHSRPPYYGMTTIFFPIDDLFPLIYTSTQMQPCIIRRRRNGAGLFGWPLPRATLEG